MLGPLPRAMDADRDFALEPGLLIISARKTDIAS